MKKHIGIAVLLLLAALLGGCKNTGKTQEESTGAPQGDATEAPSGTPVASDTEGLADGTYLAEFQTDSGMFHVSEACDGKGTLTVENGKMTIHISLASKNIVNLFPGRAEDAKKEGAKLLAPTEDTVTYSDGMTEEVYGFDVPVPALDTEFDLALIGTKGKWYDHKASVTNPVPAEGDAQGKSAGSQKDSGQGASEDAQKDGTQEKRADTLKDGTYRVDIAFEGGSGRAEILSPAMLTVADGKMTATIQWSSPNYDYMLVGGEKYLPTHTEGGSVFEFPVSGLDEPMDVIGDTVAMSRPHEVEYMLTFQSGTIKEE